MKKLFLLIILGNMFLYACTPATISTPTIEVKSTTAEPLPTETIVPTPAIEPINGGWSTFSSSEFGFSLQYPTIYDKGFQSFEFTCNISVEEDNSNDLFVVIGDILVNAEKTEKNLAEYTTHFIENNRQGWDVKPTEIEINGLVAKRLEYHRAKPPRGGDVTIVVNKDRAVVVQYFDANFIDCGLKDDGYSSHWVYEQMIASLRFQE